MKNLLIFIVLLPFLGAANLKAQDVSWESKLEVAMAKAAAEEAQKFVLLHFTADWCRPCQQLDTFVFRNSMVQSAIRENVVPLRIDVDANPGLAKEYGVTTVPYDVVINVDGRILSSRKSPLDSFGYARMISMLKRIEANSNSSANSGIQREIEELREKFQPKRIAAKKCDFTPTAPTHSMPGITREGRDLQRRNAGVKVITNPFFDPENARTKIATDSKSESGIRVADANQPAEKKIKPRRITNPNFVPAANKQEIVATLPREVAEPGDDSGAFVPPTNKAIASNNSQKNEATTATPNQTAPATSDNGFQPPQLVGKREVSPTGNGQPELEFPGAQAPAAIEPAAVSAQPSGENLVDSNADLKKDEPFKLPTMEQRSPSPGVTELHERKIVFGLKKKCPVTLATESRWADGDEKWGCVHRGVTYLFASEAKLHEFQAAPDKYSPLLAGYDPVTFHESGELNFGTEDFGVFMGKAGDQQIVLFASAKNRDKFKTNPRLYLDTVRVATTRADTNTIR